jgi:hypothetical protein
MKNIHILPTEEESRLQVNKHKKMFLSQEPKAYLACINQNIYITNSEEIKEGDYCIIVDAESALYGQFEKHKGKHLRNDQWEKIILTTDQDLIKDGVQSIDNEFLEWFVKNPSCERVEVEIKPMFPMYSTFIESIDNPPFYGNLKRKIIIPKEEPKQETTLEEVAESYADFSNDHVPICFGDKFNPTSKADFIAGAKWQAERMYSEEEVLVKLYECLGHFAYQHNIVINGNEIDKWFEKFKKK